MSTLLPDQRVWARLICVVLDVEADTEVGTPTAETEMVKCPDWLVSSVVQAFLSA
jgi:hypothetical protein